MTQRVISLESMAVFEDAAITKDEIDWTQIDWRQLLIITVVRGVVAVGIFYWLALFLINRRGRRARAFDSVFTNNASLRPTLLFIVAGCDTPATR